MFAQINSHSGNTPLGRNKNHVIKIKDECEKKGNLLLQLLQLDHPERENESESHV